MDKLQPSSRQKSFLPRTYKALRRALVGSETLKAEEQIEQYGFSRKSSVVEIAAVMLLLGFISILILIIVDVLNLQRVPWSQAFTAVLSLGVAIIAYRQWRAARYEISIDKYYDRLEVANKRLESLEKDKPTPEDMYAFSELDKLEYVIVKYEYGYVPPVLALRALENFRRICTDRRGFSEKVGHWVEQASYREVTRKVVGTVCERCQSSPRPL